MDRSNEYAQANSILQINAMFNGIHALLAGDGELSDIYTRTLMGEQLAPTEETRFSAFVKMFLSAVENLAVQQKLELEFNELDSGSAVVLMAPLLKKLVQTKADGMVEGGWAKAICRRL